MAKINMVVPGFSPRTFSGGLWSLMEFASGLAARGHEVTVVPVLPCRHKPRWFPRPAGRIVTSSTAERFARLGIAAKNCAAAFLHVGKGHFGEAMGDLTCACLNLRSGWIPEDAQVGMACRYLRQALPPADLTLATASWTALPVRLSGRGRLFYFMQHYEPYFFSGDGKKDERFGKTQAEISYGLGLEMIANSSWLKKKIEADFPGTSVRLCSLAVDHSVFNGNPREKGHGGTATVISYSGRRVAWKGFREMAEAVKIARDTLRGTSIRWLVYGPEAVLPPENPIASYEWLGFLQPSQLAEAYRSADLMLSASWYESCPLFPLEAMACGLPVITTPFGTEDYAIPAETAEVVSPRDPRSIAGGLIRLIQDPRYSRRIACGGKEISRQFTWEKSVSTMEQILVRAAPESLQVALPLGACH